MAKKAKSRNGPTIRFAALIRVSTEKQADQGESLRVQSQQIEEAVGTVGGRVVAWYGGQEHAMPGHEKQQVDLLIADSKRNKFDAVMVAHEDRWSRDNVKSAQGLDTFLANDVRFFVLSRECELHDPTIRFMLAQHAVIGQFFAANQAKKAVESKIARAKRGIPSSGKLPFGRTFDRARLKAGADPQSCWGIDKTKRQRIQEIAKRYLAGEKLPDLADEVDMNYSYLLEVLTLRCGTDWAITFDDPRFKIHEVVTLKIPRLLPEATIQKILKKVAANKTYSHGHSKNKYLLSRMVFCEHCGYAMTGQPPSHPGRARLYRHQYLAKQRVKQKHTCPCTVKCGKNIDADVIEGNVLRELFTMFGNPAGVKRAIDAAIPNRDQIADLQQQRTRVADAIEKANGELKALVRLASKGKLTDDEVGDEATAIRERICKDEERLRTIDAQLNDVPTGATIAQVTAEGLAMFESLLDPGRKRTRRNIGLVPMNVNGEERLSAEWALKVEDINEHIDRMSYADQRALCETVFGHTLPDGKRAGVYVRWFEDKHGVPKWAFSIRGILMSEGMMPRDVTEFDAGEPKPAKRPTKTNKKTLVTKYASY